MVSQIACVWDCVSSHVYTWSASFRRFVRCQFPVRIIDQDMRPEDEEEEESESEKESGLKSSR
jgi:hypothetical protein